MLLWTCLMHFDNTAGNFSTQTIFRRFSGFDENWLFPNNLLVLRNFQWTLRMQFWQHSRCIFDAKPDFFFTVQSWKAYIFSINIFTFKVILWTNCKQVWQPDLSCSDKSSNFLLDCAEKTKTLVFSWKVISLKTFVLTRRMQDGNPSGIFPNKKRNVVNYFSMSELIE